jgi:hypothetical protein
MVYFNHEKLSCSVEMPATAAFRATFDKLFQEANPSAEEENEP